MANCADPDQLASSEANWSGFTVFWGRVYPGSAGQGLSFALPLSSIKLFRTFNVIIVLIIVELDLVDDDVVVSVCHYVA